MSEHVCLYNNQAVRPFVRPCSLSVRPVRRACNGSGIWYERFSIVNRLEAIENNYYIYPDQTAPIVISHSPNKLYLARWGFPVSWSPRPLINAKAETIDILSTFKESFKFHRCLIPTQVFYEWDHRVKPAQMTLFRLKSNEFFALAGLYNEVIDEVTGKPVLHFVIITTRPIAWSLPFTIT